MGGKLSARNRSRAPILFHAVRLVQVVILLAIGRIACNGGSFLVQATS